MHKASCTNPLKVIYIHGIQHFTKIPDYSWLIQYFYIYNAYYDKKENVLCFLFPGTAGRSLRKEDQPAGEIHAPLVALALVGAALIVVAVILCADVPRDTEIQRRTIQIILVL